METITETREPTDRRKIGPCTCEHEFQDSVYGHRNRVWNMRTTQSGKFNGWRCTVCGKEVSK